MSIIFDHFTKNIMAAIDVKALLPVCTNCNALVCEHPRTNFKEVVLKMYKCVLPCNCRFRREKRECGHTTPVKQVYLLDRAEVTVKFEGSKIFVENFAVDEKTPEELKREEETKEHQEYIRSGRARLPGLNPILAIAIDPRLQMGFAVSPYPGCIIPGHWGMTPYGYM